MRRRPSRVRGSDILIGIMSGTSADGIDVVAVRIRGRGLRMQAEFIDHLARPFPAALRRRLLAAMAPAQTRTEEIARLHTELGQAFADAALAMIERLGPKNRPVAIGLAGQTVCHLPCSVQPPWRTTAATEGRRYRLRTQNSELATITFQLGNPHILAARTGTPVIADFRQSDVAAGGQGAPLVPWTDWVLFHGSRRHCAVQNIGGIGNVTFIPAGGGPEDVIAFDTGPGNMIIDALVQLITDGRQRMDRDGRRARRGRVLTAVLDRWMKHPFLQLPPPRTTGRETFGRVFVEAELPRLRAASRDPDDWVATATAFTARTIADAYGRFLPAGEGLRCAPPGLAAPAGRSAGIFSDKRSPGYLSDLRPMSRVHRGPRSGGVPRSVVGIAEKSASSCTSVKNTSPLEVILCGGGARNPLLRAMLAGALPGARLSTIDAWGIPSDAKEAVSFALLARAALDRVPANLPQATGAARPARLGLRVDPP